MFFEFLSAHRKVTAAVALGSAGVIVFAFLFPFVALAIVAALISFAPPLAGYGVLASLIVYTGLFAAFSLASAIVLNVGDAILKACGFDYSPDDDDSSYDSGELSIDGHHMSHDTDESPLRGLLWSEEDDMTHHYTGESKPKSPRAYQTFWPPNPLAYRVNKEDDWQPKPLVDKPLDEATPELAVRLLHNGPGSS